MRRILLATMLWTAGCGGGTSAWGAIPPSGSSPAPLPQTATIQHVVVIIQENHSFDNYFHAFPGADAADSGLDHNNVAVPLHQISLHDTTQFDIGHTHPDFVTDYNGGAMNGFDHGHHGYNNYAYTYVDPSDIAPYWSLASQYTLADHMFQSNTGASFVAHQYLIAGQAANTVDIPYLPNSGQVAVPWGCDSPAGTVIDQFDASGTTSQSVTPCFSYATLATLLDAKNISWKFYAPTIDAVNGDFGQVWSAFDAISPVRYGSDWKNVSSPETTILADAATGHLPAVSWVVPAEQNSDHPGDGAGGPQWVASVVNAIGSGPNWSNTAIFIVWDDWGGWYDHVSPPQLDVNGLGFRVPLIVVSPYAKPHFVSKKQYEFGSILRFIETNFALGALGTTDTRAQNLDDCFNLSQPPLTYHPLTTTRSPQDFMREPPSSKPPDDY